MQINKTNINFKGIYKIENTPENSDAIKNKIGPLYEMATHQPLKAFVGSTPIDLGLEIVLKDSPYSQDWLRQNAKNNGIDISVFGEDTIHIITGKKDCESIDKFVEKRQKKMLGFWNRFKMLRKLSRNIVDNDIPQHLRILYALAELCKIEKEHFKEFTQNKVIEVKTPEELVVKITDNMFKD